MSPDSYIPLPIFPPICSHFPPLCFMIRVVSWELWRSCSALPVRTNWQSSESLITYPIFPPPHVSTPFGLPLLLMNYQKTIFRKWQDFLTSLYRNFCLVYSFFRLWVKTLRLQIGGCHGHCHPLVNKSLHPCLGVEDSMRRVFHHFLPFPLPDIAFPLSLRIQLKAL